MQGHITTTPDLLGLPQVPGGGKSLDGGWGICLQASAVPCARASVPLPLLPM